MHKKYRILICDVNIKPQGHYIGFNQYLIDHANLIGRNNPSVEVYFLFNREAKKFLSFPADPLLKIHFIDLKPGNSGWKRFDTMMKVKHFTIAHSIDHLLFMDLDQYQIPFYFIRFQSDISGILFRPHHRIESAGTSFSMTVKTVFKRLKKKTSEKLFLRSSSMKNIFILNDQEGAALLNRIHHSCIFKYLPDPIFSYSDYRQKKNLERRDHSIYKYLIFGSVSERKNISNIIRAYNQAVMPVRTQLLIVGPGSDDYIKYLKEMISGLSSIDGLHKSVFIKGAFVSNEEMDYYFSICNTCLLIYKDFFGSSGLLGRAALHKLKVVGAATGLLKKMIDTYRMGMTADPLDIPAIARALQAIIHYPVFPDDLERFYAQHSPERFLGMLTESVAL
jgi:glycosyltransferase involved in cell wall biosynthesis